MGKKRMGEKYKFMKTKKESEERKKILNNQKENKNNI